MNTIKIKTVTLFATLLVASALTHAETAEADNIARGLAISVEVDKRDTGFIDSTANMTMELRKHLKLVAMAISPCQSSTGLLMLRAPLSLLFRMPWFPMNNGYTCQHLNV